MTKMTVFESASTISGQTELEKSIFDICLGIGALVFEKRGLRWSIFGRILGDQNDASLHARKVGCSNQFKIWIQGPRFPQNWYTLSQSSLSGSQEVKIRAKIQIWDQKSKHFQGHTLASQAHLTSRWRSVFPGGEVDFFGNFFN